jgi:catechol 2,3-dioxygenase-like lactoylglutathione lyase family enzyme
MIRGIHHISVHCRDLERMVQFYKAAFGFEVIDQFEWSDAEIVDKLIDVPGSAAKGCMLKAGSCYMELFEFVAPKPASPDPKRPYDKGYTHFCVDVTDIEKEFTRLQGLGMTFGPDAPIDMGHVKSVYGRDPEGNIIEIQQTAADCVFRMDKLPPLPA